MKITAARVVPDSAKDSDADLRTCSKCGGPSFFVPQSVTVLTPGGARRWRVWACEQHPIPADEPVVYDGPMAS